METEEIKKDTEEKKRGRRKDVSFVDPTDDQVSDKHASYVRQSCQTEQKELTSDFSDKDFWRC